VYAFYVNLRSNTIPKYSNSFEIGRPIPPIVREGGDSTGLLEKKTTSDFVVLMESPKSDKKTLTANCIK
jgi:hypothetical protein